MPIEVRLPELAESMTSATVTAWLKRVGDRVTAGEPIAEIETDKTTVELEAPVTGVLEDIRVAPGTENVAVGAVLAVLREGASTPEAVRSTDTDQGGALSAPPSEAPARANHPPSAPARPPVVSAAGSSAAVPATALARRMAAIAGIDLTAVQGSGDHGRVGKADVERVLSARTAGGPEAPSGPTGAVSARQPSRPKLSDAEHEDRPLSAMRRVTAERMAHAKQTVPHFYLEIDCAVDRLLALRDEATAGGETLTVTDVIVRAIALALGEVPLANSAWTGEAVRVYETADIAVAVTTPTGLVAPVVRAAGGKQLRAIATELRDLVERARSGRLAPAEYSGATFTVSNLGMYGVSSLFAILNPPQSCILGVGVVEPRPVARDGTVVVGTMMTLTLSADHRAIDGATGAEFLRALRRLLEHADEVFA